jgi:hypothetical protein
MKRLISILAAAIAAALIAAPASSAFGVKDLDLRILDGEGAPAMDAGTHPFEVKTNFDAETEIDPELGEIPVGQIKNVSGVLPAGLSASPFAVPQCSSVDFTTVVEKLPNCSNSSVIGIARARATLANGQPAITDAPLYNLVPPPGVAAKFGFIPFLSAPVTVEAGIEETFPYRATFKATNITQLVRFLGSETTLWGNPSDPAHDADRGKCGLFIEINSTPIEPGGTCPTSNPNRPFLTLPRSCEGPLQTIFRAESWLGQEFEGSVTTHDNSVPPQPRGIGACAKVGFSPSISAKPTSGQAASPSGLDFGIDLENEGLGDPKGTANSDIEKAVVTLPKGVTANPSLAEGLAVCSEAQFKAETAGSEFGAGCPAASKIGTTEVETPLLEGELLKGSLFIARPYQNPFGTLIALYMTVKDPKLGIGIKLAAKVEPDPKTGQLITTVENIPQQPVSHFRLHFREGGRSSLITPELCGDYTTEATLTPSANPATSITKTATFHIGSGVGGGPCPVGATPPFQPGFTAGTENNAAAHYSPFSMRLTRRDGDQDLTRFSAKLPAGLVAKLAGAGECSGAQIAAAKKKTGSEEIANPSCPANSQVGHIFAGAGVGSELTYVPGKVYLAGPFNGAPLSVVGIVPAVAGPFDVGTVVAQQALRIDPRTAEVTADGAASDPIPHILAGIPLKVRDIRVNVDRPEFTLNPTSCDPLQIGAQLWGGGADVFSSADDSPLSLSSRFQAAACASLGFKPSLALKLKGGTKRGGHPALTGTYAPRPGDANLSNLVLRLPHSAFLDQAHIRTICTRVQFAAKSCPAGAVYGHATAYTPLLDQPLEGPVYLRSSSHNLPDFVADLHGLIDVEAVARIDSQNGGIRATFSEVPDAPLTKVVVQMQGGKKGLIVNSTSLCAKKHRADAAMSAHNGKTYDAKPPIKASCGRASSR